MTDLKSNNEFDSLEAFFNERLKDASVSPSGKAWEDLEAELDLIDKQKRRRRFLWFFTSGLVLLCGLASLWFFVLDDKFNTNSIAQKTEKPIAKPENKIENNISNATEKTETKTEAVASQNENKTNTAAETKNEITTETKITESSPVVTTAKTNTSKTVSGLPASTSKIQLAACSKKANPVIFNKLPYKVIEVEGKDGLIRYFAETPVTEEALATLRNSGFEKAFIKKNFDNSAESAVVKNEGVIENTEPVYVAYTKPITENKKEPVTKPVIVNNNGEINDTKPVVNETKKTKEPITIPVSSKNTGEINDTKPVVNETKNTKEPVTTPVNANNSGEINDTKPVVNETKNNATTTNETPPVVTKTEPVLQDQIPTKVDSTPPAQIAANETKPDSLPKKIEPVDSSKTATAFIAPVPFTPEWALLLIAGPNIFTSGATSSLYTTSNEQQQPTVNIEAKVQFKPFKKFSFSAGANYTYLSSKQDITDFRFNKKQKEDYVLYSSFGSMPVPMSVLLDGYSTMAPFDTFPCKYSQTSTLNMVNIPLEMNFHFLNKDKFSLYLGLGANNSFALSQSAHLTLHKENFNNELSYNNVTVNRYSLSMMFSLGCDVRIGKRLYLTFVPSYRYGVTNLSNTSGTTFNPAYFSGNAGLKFKL